MRGRKPALCKLKVLTQSSPGNDRGGHPIKVPPPFAQGGVQKPTDLSPDADEFWDKVVPELERVARGIFPRSGTPSAFRCNVAEEGRDGQTIQEQRRGERCNELLRRLQPTGLSHVLGKHAEQPCVVRQWVGLRVLLGALRKKTPNL